MKRYVITDLTRFSNPDIFCTAAIDIQSGKCHRPMPYLTSQSCKKLNMHPGAILEGEMFLKGTVERPHVEDSTFNKLKYVGACTSQEFKAVLDLTLSQSVSHGFKYQFPTGEKIVPTDVLLDTSIITLKVNPKWLDIHEDKFKPGKIKCSFTDSSGAVFRYLPITDRGFHDYALSHISDGKINELKLFVQNQREVYLRIGLSRNHKSNEREGYWLQVNGIYTFPDFLDEIRSY